MIRTLFFLLVGSVALVGCEPENPEPQEPPPTPPPYDPPPPFPTFDFNGDYAYLKGWVPEGAAYDDAELASYNIYFESSYDTLGKGRPFIVRIPEGTASSGSYSEFHELPDTVRIRLGKIDGSYVNELLFPGHHLVLGDTVELNAYL